MLYACSLDRVSDPIWQAYEVDRRGFDGARAPSLTSGAGSACEPARGTVRHPGSWRRMPAGPGLRFPGPAPRPSAAAAGWWRTRRWPATAAWGWGGGVLA